MNFNLSDITLSKNDIKRGVKLPVKVTKELAEFIGIMIGDGHLGYYKGINRKGHKYVTYQIKIAGSKREENYAQHIQNLFGQLFGVTLCYAKEPGEATILRKYSRGIMEFLNKKCGIPLNNKCSIVKIPTIIKNNNKNIQFAFLRGLADTDYSVTFKNRTKKGHNYPVITGGFKSQRLVNDIEELYREMGFKYCVLYNQRRYDKREKSYSTINCIYLNGKENFRKWMKEIGFSNNKFQKKTTKWFTEGVCPPGYP